MQMALRFNKHDALALVRREAIKAAAGEIDSGWSQKIEHLSKLCSDGASTTHIAFLGTVILAKSMQRSADLFVIKPKLAPDNPNAFSARTLCHSVLVPLAAELGMSLGVTGREPLNNQPYFRMTRLGDDTPVHAGGRAAFNYMIGLVNELQAMPDEVSAQVALRAYIDVRRRHQRSYDDFEAGGNITPEFLLAAITTFVRENSEGGKRAQAVVAGLMDTFAGVDRVESGRINDPSRRYPGDVCVRLAADRDIWEKALEVRDKPVSENDVKIFAKKCIDMGVREACVVMISERQSVMNQVSLHQWANGFGIGLTLFVGWSVFVEQALFWAEQPKPLAATKTVLHIRNRLIAVEASSEAITSWQRLSKAVQAT